MLFLHGQPGGAFIWAPVIAGLARNRRAIAPDLPGWGRSISRFSDHKFHNTPAELQGWLKGVLAAHQIDRFDLVAHGNSVWPALELFQTNPARVRRLSLVSARLWPVSRPWDEPRALIGSPRWSAKQIARWLTNRSTLSETAFPAWQHHFRGVLGGPPEKRSAEPIRFRDYSTRFHAFQSAMESYPGAMLFLWGANDPNNSPDAVGALTAPLDRPAVHCVDKAGAFPMLDSPEIVAALFTEFLSD